MMTKLQNDIFKISDDIYYDVFCKVVSFDQRQIVRYCRDGISPLWFSGLNMLTEKTPKCKNCGSELIFEFQVKFTINLDYAKYLQPL